MPEVLRARTRPWLSLKGGFLLAEIFVEDERAEGEDRCHERLEAKSIVPLIGGAELGEPDNIEQEQNPVDRSHDPDGQGQAYQVLHQGSDGVHGCLGVQALVVRKNCGRYCRGPVHVNGEWMGSKMCAMKH